MPAMDIRYWTKALRQAERELEVAIKRSESSRARKLASSCMRSDSKLERPR
jgi:hypothetical protein